MSVARCYECSACGGLVRETARTCNYCGSDIATVRCSRCFMMNVTEALHCIGCGSALGLMPLPAESARIESCPRCRVHRLDAFGNDGEIVYDCSKCGGQFVVNEVLSVMISRYQACITNFPKRIRPNNPLTDKVEYLPCPFCKDLMIRRNFGHTSGIVVDVCAKHGTWFDMGELARILAFVGQGGLSVGATSSPDAKLDALAGGLHYGTTGPSLIGGMQGVTHGERFQVSDMEEATVAFIRWVREMLR